MLIIKEKLKKVVQVALGLVPLVALLAAGNAYSEPRVTYLEEMAALPLDDYGPLHESCPLTVAADEMWQRMFDFVVRAIPDWRIRRLSRWAVGEMEDYHFAPVQVPPLVVYGCNASYKVYKSTLDILPSHHRSVTRLPCKMTERCRCLWSNHWTSKV